MSKFDNEREELLNDLQSLSPDSGNVKEASADNSLDDVDDICSSLETLEKQARAGEIGATNDAGQDQNLPTGEEAAQDGQKPGVANGQEAAQDGIRDGVVSGQEANDDAAHHPPEMQEAPGEANDGAPSGSADGASGEESPDQNVEGAQNTEVPDDQEQGNPGSNESAAKGQEGTGEKQAAETATCPECGNTYPAEMDECPECGCENPQKSDKEAGDMSDLPPEMREQAEEAKQEGGVDEANESGDSEDSEEESGEEESDEEESEEEESEDKEANLSPEAQALETDVIESAFENMFTEKLAEEATSEFAEKVADYRDTNDGNVSTDEADDTGNRFLQRL